MNKSLTKKIFWLVTVGLLISLMILMGLVWRESQITIEKSVSEQQLLLSKKTMEQIDYFLYERYYDIGVISKSVRAGEILINKGKLDFEETDWIGYELVKRGPWVVVSLVNNEGKITTSTNQNVVGEVMESFPEEEKVYEEAKKGKVVYTDLVNSKISGTQTVVYAAPVWSEKDGVKFKSGVLVGHIAWPLVEELLNNTKFDSILVNIEGVVIAQKLEFGTNNLLGKDISETAAVEHVKVGLEHAMKSPSISGDYQSLTSHTIEKGYLDFEGHGWALIFELPVELAFVGAQELMGRLLLLIIPVLMLLGVVVVYLMNRNIVKPIREMTKVSGKIAKGDFKIKINIRSGDELGVLAKSFNDMAKQLDVSQKELELKVVEKTKEFEEKNKELEKMNKLMVGRELKMIEMKKTIREIQDSTLQQAQNLTSRLPDDIGDEQAEVKAPNEGERLETPISEEISREKPEK